MSKKMIKENLGRMTWAVADQLIVDKLAPVLSAGSSSIFFGGSYCRRLPTCGDIDVLLFRNDLTDKAIDTLFAMYMGTYLANGGSLKRMILQIDSLRFQLDMWIVDDRRAWGPMSMFVAGDGQLNAIQRAQASRAGYKLGTFLVDIKSGAIINTPTERDVYSFLGWAWKPYPTRSLIKK